MPRQPYSAGEAARRLGISTRHAPPVGPAGAHSHRGETLQTGASSLASEIDRLRGPRRPTISPRATALTGTVREVRIEGLLAQVEIEAGPFRIVSVITSEAAEQLGLEPGVPATALVKATSVLIER